MPLEKAFAIHAEPAAIWRSLMDELRAADPGTFELERSLPNEELTIRVQLHGVGARITYRLLPRPDHTEVVAVMEPEGLRYHLLQILTLGRANTGYELALAQGLSNLKQAAEGRPPPEGENDNA